MSSQKLQALPGDTIRIDFPNGDRLTVRVGDGSAVIHGSGDRMGKVAIEPNGSNTFEVRVIA
ncbi:hypothetical protein GS534_00715 [Rhodococcus hoagii]|nr:hypothetical protein [Prescottella equi]